MLHEFSRTELVIGTENLEKLKNSRIAIFGVGGVGSYVVEALARSGVGTLDLFDHDTISLTNLNRQLIATHDTIGKAKVEESKKRVLSINPKAIVNTNKVFYTKENCQEYPFASYDYVVDAIDTVSAKLLLVEQAKASGVPIISCMGTGNKLDPTKLEVSDISKTSVCPLAKVMRRELKKRGIYKLKVVYSKELPIKAHVEPSSTQGDQKEGIVIETKGSQGRPAPGSVAFVPPVAGMIIAATVIKDLSC
ncbi:MAG TPA: tRNA threonylcarbamoyladenosine dehydratase [Candidatus Merdenecus merdavium]|nr:tRNA threonylcarbamoyladenosine dehydratase [Candidatus Merdenecus merdavium]